MSLVKEKMVITLDQNKRKTPYYIFYADEFIQNYYELQHAFCSIYSKFQIAYSFKTNYTPAVCELVKSLGGFAEVVSDMEYTLAKKIGYPDNRIIYNGPGKGKFLESCVLEHGLLHIDNSMDINRVVALARQYTDKEFSVGIRANFDIENGLHSRFGLDVENGEFGRALKRIQSVGNIKVNGLHFHISRARGKIAWSKRIEKLMDIADTYFDYPLDYIDIGSGMFGHLEPELKEQFGDPPSYKDYAEIVAGKMEEHYNGLPESQKPILVVEPGTTVVSKYFRLYTTVLDIKEIRSKFFGLLDSGIHNVGEICVLKKVPVKNLGSGKNGREYKAIDLVGYTCLEQDVIFPNYQGKLAVGDILEIQNVGGYSIVDKPPFIHPDIPIYMKKNEKIECIKREQTFDDIFAPYFFGVIETAGGKGYE